MTALLRAPDRPTAVCCANDEIAFGAIDAARTEGLSCPGDLSIIGFDDGLWATVCRPALTTVRFEFFNAGRRAAEALSRAALTGEAVTDLTFEPAYRPGQTIGPVPASS